MINRKKRITKKYDLEEEIKIEKTNKKFIGTVFSGFHVEIYHYSYCG